MKKIVTWSATYETVVELPDGSSERDFQDAAASIDLDVPGSTYQQDSWDVESIRDWEAEGGKVLA